MPRFLLPPLWLRPLVIIILILGFIFRFMNIDRKVFWQDEVFTALRVSGYDSHEAITQITGQVINVGALQKIQKINPDKSIINTVISLATDDPHHPPLYYIITRIWVQTFGDSVANFRTPSVLISLLVLPLAYWLCWELFHSSLVAWLAVIFFAISPFQVLYDQEAREYGLCIVMILLGNLTFLLAIRHNNIRSWAIYSLCLTANYYTSIFTIPVAIGQGMYTLIENKFKPNQITISHFLAGLISLALFAPWIRIMIKYRNTIYEYNAWSGINSSSSESIIQYWGLYVQYWSLHISRIFVDIFNDFWDIRHPKYYIFPIIYTLLLTYAIYFLIKTTESRIWLLLICLLLLPVLYLIIPDIIMGGIRSQVGRYFVPWYVTIPIIIAHLFAYLITQKINQGMIVKQRLWQGVFIGIISLSILSCATSSQPNYWWNKSFLAINVFRIGEVINKVTKPLVISNLYGTNFGDVIALSYRVNQQTKFLLVLTPDLPEIPQGFSNVYLFNPSDSFINKFRAKYGANTIKALQGTTLLELKITTP